MDSADSVSFWSNTRCKIRIRLSGLGEEQKILDWDSVDMVRFFGIFFYLFSIFLIYLDYFDIYEYFG